MTPEWRIDVGDCRELLAAMPEQSVQTCVTSPPYFGLRDYGHDGQIGLEPTPDEFVAPLVEVFRGVRRVLRDDGTVWLNLGDSYAGSWGAQSRGTTSALADRSVSAQQIIASIPPDATYKAKDLLGIPWMVAFALRADGWYLRSDIIWHKPNPMPESVTDRPTKAHEYVFLLSKGPRYFYDADAIAEATRPDRPEGPTWDERAAAGATWGNARNGRPGTQRVVHGNGLSHELGAGEKRNKRSVWTVATQPYAGAHFATFPPKLIEPCILAGSREGDTVLDPFAGAGTTGMVALRHGRSFVGCELNPAYASLARERIIDDAPLLNSVGMVA
jgi:DNA modification methylase